MFSRSAPKSVVPRKVSPAVSEPASSSSARPAVAVSGNPRQIAHQASSPRQVAQASVAAVGQVRQLASLPGKISSRGYWVAKKTHTVHTGGREWRYWNQGTGATVRKSGWYGRDRNGGWDEASTPLISDAPLNTSEAGVELISRLDQPFALIAAEPGTSLAYEVDDSFADIGAGEGRARSSRDRGIMTPMPSKLQLERFSELAAWCQNIDELISLFENNETDVTTWRNRLAALSGAQIALGLVGAGLMISAIVATGGLAAIPMTAAGIAIAVSSGAAGVGIGAARAVADRGLANARQEGGVQHGRAVLGGKELAKGSGAIGAKEGLTRGLMATTEVGSQAIGAVAGGGGAAISVVTGSMGLYKAAKVDVGAIWEQVDWQKALKNVTDAEAFLDRHSSGFNPGMLILVKKRLKDTGEKISNISRNKNPRWS
ncbi:hypothetical protein [Spirosoma flavum]|uniref:Uncharacterized protein n=1 Tax=Spirosoma flavum TaxID=2048557 RepID=A0ABW6AGU3_9BACT